MTDFWKELKMTWPFYRIWYSEITSIFTLSSLYCKSISDALYRKKSPAWDVLTITYGLEIQVGLPTRLESQLGGKLFPHIHTAYLYPLQMVLSNGTEKQKNDFLLVKVQQAYLLEFNLINMAASESILGRIYFFNILYKELQLIQLPFSNFWLIS